MAKKQQSQALEVLSKLDGATLDSLLALLLLMCKTTSN